MKFHCPKCKQELRCGCKSCRKRYGDVEGMMLPKDDLDACPKCGYTAHVDTWMDIEYEQLRIKNP